MGRFGRGWYLTKVAFRVVRSNGSLVALTVLGGAAALLVALAAGIPAAILYDDDRNVLATVLAVVAAYAATFLAVFFGVALVAAAARVLDGGDATVSDGIAAARARLTQIAGWALFLLTVNLAIQLVRERLGIAGDVIAGLAGVAWGLATFLVVPVVAFEGLGPWTALKRSSSLFRDRWGESLAGTFAIGAIFALAGVLPAVVIGAIAWNLDSDVVRAVLFGVAIALAIVAIVLARTVSAVFSVALYRFAAGEGAATGPFSDADLQGAVRRKTGLAAAI